MSDGKQEASALHRWIYTMIPVSYRMIPTFTAFCPNCRTLYSEIMPIPYGIDIDVKNDYPTYPNVGSWTTNKSQLPKTGCVLPDGLPVV